MSARTLHERRNFSFNRSKFLYMRAKVWKYFGIVSISVFCLGVFISKIQNSWFDISKHTLSKLGRLGLANDPWIFSIFVAIAGAIMVLYGIYMIIDSSSKLKIVGSAYVLLSGIFMILVGLFPDGTKPHNFIALFTFLSFYTGMMLYGLGSSNRFFKISTLVIFLVIVITLIFKLFKALGYLEVFGLTLIILELILFLFEGG